MSNSQKVYQVEHDFWIYGLNRATKQDALETLKRSIHYGRELPDSILIAMVRGLQKIEDMSEKDFQENNEIFSNNEKIEQINETYCEYMELEKKDFWRKR